MKFTLRADELIQNNGGIMMKRYAQVTESVNEKLKNTFSYDSEKGQLRWKVKPTPSIDVGYIAGRRHQNGHIEVCLDGITYMGHHLAWFLHYGKWPTRPILHANKNKADNRLQNLVAKI